VLDDIGCTESEVGRGGVLDAGRDITAGGGAGRVATPGAGVGRDGEVGFS
jgi:hypothetical protein